MNEQQILYAADVFLSTDQDYKETSKILKLPLKQVKSLLETDTAIDYICSNLRLDIQGRSITLEKIAAVIYDKLAECKSPEASIELAKAIVALKSEADKLSRSNIQHDNENTVKIIYNTLENDEARQDP